MVRKSTGRKHVTGTSVTTKSWFGSHAEMIVEDRGDGTVVCEDDKGKSPRSASRLVHYYINTRYFTIIGKICL